MPGMEAQVAVAKVHKFGSTESGDTLEMIERPSGGLSLVLVDGQTSGRHAKAVAGIVARKAISLLADGVRDGAAARAASDYLYTQRSGKVLATLNILSVDLLLQQGALGTLDGPVDPVGGRKGVRPEIHEVPLQTGLVAIVFTDGLIHAGERSGRPIDLVAKVHELATAGAADPARWAESLLTSAVTLEDGRPSDDISILVAAILPRQGEEVRRLTVRMPF